VVFPQCMHTSFRKKLSRSVIASTFTALRALHLGRIPPDLSLRVVLAKQSLRRSVHDIAAIRDCFSELRFAMTVEGTSP